MLKDVERRFVDQGLDKARSLWQGRVEAGKLEPAELERNTVGAPFVDRAFGGMTQGARHRRFEERQRIGCRTDEKIAVRRDIDDTLMPAAGLFDRLVNWQRIDEFVGDDDARAAGDILEFIVPQDRHVEIVKLALLHLLQRGT